MERVFTPKVVWVAQWYPHEGEPYTGDFIQRHARALALYQPVQVFACFPHSGNRQETITNGNLTETILYFKSPKTPFRKFTKFLRWYRWKSLLQNALIEYSKQKGKPDWIHCHITLNAAWLGLWAKRKWGTPYIITEHWSGYMPGAPNGFNKYNHFSKRLFHKLISQADRVTTVSKALSNELQSIENHIHYSALPNVVDETIFNPIIKSSVSGKKRLLHISTFSYQKNVPMMLVAFDKVAAGQPDIEFHIVGSKHKFRQQFPQQADDPHYVLHGEISQQAIAELMHLCDACVLYSHYETFGCVIIEANATGLPVIVSDIPVLREIVKPNENGMLVTPNDAQALANAILSFYSGEVEFNNQQIARKTVEKYAFSVIGQQLADLYNAPGPAQKS